MSPSALRSSARAVAPVTPASTKNSRPSHRSCSGITSRRLAGSPVRNRTPVWVARLRSSTERAMNSALIENRDKHRGGRRWLRPRPSRRLPSRSTTPSAGSAVAVEFHRWSKYPFRLGRHRGTLGQPSVGIDFGLATCLEAGCRREGFGVGGEDRPGQQGILG